METKTEATVHETEYYGQVIYKDRMMDKTTIAFLDELLDHVYMDEQKHFESCDESDRLGHIFHNIEKLAQWAEDAHVDMG